MTNSSAKHALLPKLAFSGIRKNGSVYIPYLAASSIAVAIFFIFSAVSQNKLMKNIPYSDYVVMLMYIGQFLLCVILAPFLSSINSFLIKRRKLELGLYSILGLEKKHIGIIMVIETIINYFISVFCGIIIAIVFSKFIFMLLLNLTGLPISTDFTVSPISFIITFIYFGAVSLFNLGVNLFKVSMTNPIELFKSSKKGEKQPKHVVLRTVFGILFMGGGYFIALTAKLDSSIFLTFLFAVWLVVMGTHFLFTSGSISFIKSCMKNKKFYYRKENFITISGMLYRLKKSASGLVNICIFGTMAIITLICTISLFLGQNEVIKESYPMEAEYFFNADSSYDTSAFDGYIRDLSSADSVRIKDRIDFAYAKLSIIEKDGQFLKYESNGMSYPSDMRLITIADYNKIQNENKTLSENEVLLFSSGTDYGKSVINIHGAEFSVKEELKNLSFVTKVPQNPQGSDYYIVMSSTESIDREITAFGYDKSCINYCVHFNMDGDETAKRSFLNALDEKFNALTEHHVSGNIYDYSDDLHALYGGLLFLGIFFGIIFSVCMILIMYYKQISEGFEDKANFDIMRKVGMSDDEVKKTIRRQVQMIFLIPISAAILHTIIAVKIISMMMVLLKIYSLNLIILCALGVIAVFGIFYAISYAVTARAYYKIVK